jgi:hypothetical protein
VERLGNDAERSFCIDVSSGFDRLHSASSVHGSLTCSAVSHAVSSHADMDRWDASMSLVPSMGYVRRGRSVRRLCAELGLSHGWLDRQLTWLGQRPRPQVQRDRRTVRVGGPARPITPRPFVLATEFLLGRARP